MYNFTIVSISLSVDHKKYSFYMCIKPSPSCPYNNDSTQFIDFVYWFRASSWIKNKSVTNLNFPKMIDFCEI